MLYTTLPGDSLPSVAEKYGHSGEWAALLYFNEAILSDYNNVQPGTELVIPDEWNTDAQPKDASEPKDASGGSSSTSSRVSSSSSSKG